MQAEPSRSGGYCVSEAAHRAVRNACLPARRNVVTYTTPELRPCLMHMQLCMCMRHSARWLTDGAYV
jgi:hypothetical protein